MVSVCHRQANLTIPHKDMDRIIGYHCQAEFEEFNGDFERVPREWYPGPSQ